MVQREINDNDNKIVIFTSCSKILYWVRKTAHMNFIDYWWNASEFHFIDWGKGPSEGFGHQWSSTSIPEYWWCCRSSGCRTGEKVMVGLKGGPRQGLQHSETHGLPSSPDGVISTFNWVTTQVGLCLHLEMRLVQSLH